MRLAVTFWLLGQRGRGGMPSAFPTLPWYIMNVHRFRMLCRDCPRGLTQESFGQPLSLCTPFHLLRVTEYVVGHSGVCLFGW